MGEIHVINQPNPVTIANKNAVEITYRLEQAVRDDIYDYITGA